MCYSEQASIRALIFGMSASIILYFKNRALGIFFGFVTLMQFYDYLFWKNTPNNKFWTKIAMITNHLQPIVLALAIVYANKQTLGRYSKIIILFYSLVILIYSANIWPHLTTTKVTPQSKPSLHWEWNDRQGSTIAYAVFVSALTVLSLENFEWPSNVVLSFITLATFFLSLYKFKNVHAVGRFWCHYAAFVPLVLIFV